MRKITLVLGALAALFLPAATGVCGVYVVQDAAGRTTSLTGLYDELGCVRRAAFGHVVKRTFDDDGVTLREIVIERATGVRDVVNVDAPESNWGRATVDIVDAGLQRLTKIGRRVRVLVLICGVDGGVEDLSEIR
jgi:hypothetical protein